MEKYAALLRGINVGGSNVIKMEDLMDGCKGVVYASRLISLASRSGALKINQMPIYQNMTVRSWNTAVKILELMEAM